MMMKQVIISAILLFLSYPELISQNGIDSVLSEIDNNNTALNALRIRVEAEKIGNKTDIFPDNPEAEFHFLDGEPDEIGNRKDLSISQSFEFPTVYYYQNQISSLENKKLEFEYIEERKLLLHNARLIMYDLIYYNALESELKRRVDHAERISASYKSSLEEGESNILEYNKAKINMLNVSKELESVRISRNDLLKELAALNGGMEIDFNVKEYSIPSLPVDFEEWYNEAVKDNPELNLLKEEVKITEKEVKLSRAKALPEIKAGYMSEKVVNEQFRGLTMGISIPLWRDKNKIKYAMASAEAMKSAVENKNLLYYHRMKSLHEKFINLREVIGNYRQELNTLNHTALVGKALEKGEISLIDYILELRIYYESFEKMLELERDLNKNYAELTLYSRNY